MKSFDFVALLLVIIGALNWGLIALFKLDLVASVFGTMSGFSRIIYGLVGLSGIYAISFFTKDSRNHVE
ncbi:DUF378 domain-containing protein [Clostridium algidicarnis]|uniref:DUF378 domain-containing protein n=1 Tax=Clostridium algidicarnis TaxID=37659 RepID=UPI001C0AEB4C|nr:DUF378 domain-containing protein [Clostridium algidicarnis]MBU3192852.1 DUF378 domain-containing protein [Clostridium algidicarnis]MBU3203557.1 DUF378 domain-containing protein [Clostridium algidicarnis]MBU3206137.1 DUF378 domain-containing protein [Clostridium algidicarnis]MBU3211711.1 DUF378 domain-containing protein [Clostridium algidicarnis]MBU3221781.1 DUF378 domain-containing protein [Clostridium algidicarnis]